MILQTWLTTADSAVCSDFPGGPLTWSQTGEAEGVRGRKEFGLMPHTPAGRHPEWPPAEKPWSLSERWEELDVGGGQPSLERGCCAQRISHADSGQVRSFL